MRNVFGLIIISLLLLFSCKESDNVVDGQRFDSNLGQLLGSNPYDSVGIKHNETLDYVLNHCDSTVFSGVWVDDNLIDSITYYIDEYLVSINDTTGMSLYKNYIDDWVKFENPDSLVNQYRNLLISSTAITSRDSLYSTKILDLAVDIMNNTYTSTEMYNKVDSLESEILSVSWNTNEKQSLVSISLYKHSLDYHITNGSSPKKVNIIQASTKTREGVCGMVDFCAGAGYFLAATGASGGVGALPALASANTVGGAASTVSRLVGSALGWWDFW
ncbi:MAG: hypothetical protein WC121_04885 [Candidatus Kapaibacterium sp.]